MYLSTCNRVEFIFSGSTPSTSVQLESLVKTLLEQHANPEVNGMIEKAEVYHAEDAVKHLFLMASSIDSLVVGKEEIITQVRRAFEECKSFGLSGDVIRVLIHSTIQTAKKIYTESAIATRPVSVVSLAYFELKKYLSSPKNILVVGAGKTISSMLKFISKSHEASFFDIQ